jgi:hypothetical protein
MKAESIKYVIAGVLIAILMMLVLSAKENSISETGRYQITSTGDNFSGVYVIDTRTGVVKKVFKTGNKPIEQFGKTFEEMQPE